MEQVRDAAMSERGEAVVQLVRSRTTVSREGAGKVNMGRAVPKSQGRRYMDRVADGSTEAAGKQRVVSDGHG